MRFLIISKNRFFKLINWEYWSSYFFYIPNLPYAFYLAIKSKHLVFFSVVNPCLKSSGNGTESKYKTIKLLPLKYRPKSLLITNKNSFDDFFLLLQNEKINFPLIVKPDIGFRGLLVRKIDSLQELKKYLRKYPISIIIQEFLDYKNECGIFYYRLPNKNNGEVSSITLKHFLVVVGDGVSTLQKLILADKRARLYIDLFNKIYRKKMNYIPKQNELFRLSYIGNHSKGAQFINGNHLITKKIERAFDELSHQIQGWYYGRVDVKYNSIEDLEKGNFKILEINGIISEPTHIYDSTSITYLKALKSIRTHWKFMYKIAKINHKEKGVPYKSLKKFIKELLELRVYIKKIKKLSSN